MTFQLAQLAQLLPQMMREGILTENQVAQILSRLVTSTTKES